jgi:ribosomal protein L37AE/L43A
MVHNASAQTKGFRTVGRGSTGVWVCEKCSASAYSLLQHYMLSDELLDMFVEY